MRALDNDDSRSRNGTVMQRVSNDDETMIRVDDDPSRSRVDTIMLKGIDNDNQL